MWAYLKNLRMSRKLLLSYLVFTLFFFALTAAASWALFAQKKFSEELFKERFKGMEYCSKITAEFSQAHENISNTLRKSDLFTAVEITKIMRLQLDAIGSSIKFTESVITAKKIHDKERKAYLNVLQELRDYRQFIEKSSDFFKSNAKTFERFLAGTNERFLSVMQALQTLQKTEQDLGEEIYGRSVRKINLSITLIAAFFVISACLSVLINMLVMKKTLIAPVKSIEAAAEKVSHGDLSFDTGIQSADEIGKTGQLLTESFLSLERVLQRIKELSDRILKVVAEVEKTSEKVLSGANLEAETTESILSAMGRLNNTVTEVSGNTSGLAVSAEDASASIEQMVSSIRSINGSIQELNAFVESTSASIEQMSRTIKAVAANSDELESASDDTIAAITEIASTLKEVETNARESAGLSEKVAGETATLGLASISKTISSMKNIAETSQGTAGCIRKLGKRSDEIEMVLEVINAVNDEINLLSLNAAILAAQAGSHGKGFSVVAEEIRNLSERTEESTKKIAALIKAIQEEMKAADDMTHKNIKSVEEGLKIAKEGEESLNKILESSKKASEMTLFIKRTTEEQAISANRVDESAQRMKSMIGHIAKATAEQSEGIKLIADATENMKELSHQVSKVTGEQAATSEHIANVTEHVSEKSLNISQSLNEHKKVSQSILESIEAVKDIPIENRDLALKISKTIWNLGKDVELLGAEMERFRFSGKWGHSLRLGVVPLKEPSEMYRKFMPLSEYLTAKLERKVDLKVAIDMESAVKDLGDNITQICAMGPANYIEANKKYGVRVIAKALRKGKPYHQVAIVVKETSGIKTLRDIKGVKFAFGNVGSSTGHIMPLVTLNDAGITADDFQKYQFLGHHDKLIKAVLEGKFDATGLIDEIAQQYAGKGLRILALSPEVPEFNVCCNSSVDKKTSDLIMQALISLDVSKPDEAQIIKSLGKDCTGFVKATDKEYAVFSEKVLSVASQLNIEEHSYQIKGSGKQ